MEEKEGLWLRWVEDEGGVRWVEEVGGLRWVVDCKWEEEGLRWVEGSRWVDDCKWEEDVVEGLSFWLGSVLTFLTPIAYFLEAPSNWWSGSENVPFDILSLCTMQGGSATATGNNRDGEERKERGRRGRKGGEKGKEERGRGRMGGAGGKEDL